MRVTLLNGDDDDDDDEHDDDDHRGVVYTAVQNSKVVVVVGDHAKKGKIGESGKIGENGKTGENGKIGDGGGRGGRGGGAKAGEGGDDELLAKLVKYGSGSIAGGLRRGANGAVRAVFFVCVDGYEPSQSVLEGVGRADWYQLASPISASVSMEGDAGAPSGQVSLQVYHQTPTH